MSSRPVVPTRASHASPGIGARARRFAEDLAALAKDAGVRWVDDACYRLGAALAYYALFSLFPLLLLSVTAIGFVLGNDDTVRQKVLDSLASVGSPESRALLDQTLQSMQSHRAARGIGAIVGGVTLFLGASGVFSELESSLNLIWRVRVTTTKGVWSGLLEIVRAKAFAFGVVLAAGVVLLASLIVSTVLGAIGDAANRSGVGRVVWHIADLTVSVAFLTLLLAAIYRLVPAKEHAQHPQWRDVLGAALITSILFACLKLLLAWYLAHLGNYAAYGAVGAVLGLLTWIYVASLVLFYGAELSALYTERFGSAAGAPAQRGEMPR